MRHQFELLEAEALKPLAVDPDCRGACVRPGGPTARLAVAGILSLLLLGACANRQSKPSEPLPPISRIAMLQVVSAAELEEPPRQRNWLVRPLNRPMTGIDGRPLAPADAARASLAVAVVALVDMNIRANNADRANQLAMAESSLTFDPVEVLNAKLPVRLREIGLVTELVPDSPATRAARKEDSYKEIANGADSVLRIEVSHCCFDRDRRAGGLAPNIEIDLTLISPATDDEQADVSYEAGWGEKNNPRWFASTPDLAFADPADLVAHGDVARQGIEQLLDKMIDKMVADIKLRADGYTPKK